MPRDVSSLTGQVIVELHDADGVLLAREVVKNLITDVGDTVYASRAAGIVATAPTGMKLGTGSTAVAKNGSGAALTSYLANSQQAFDVGYPTVSDAAGAGATATYKVTYAAGKATSAGAITEAVLVNDVLADATSTVANTVARVLLTGISAKGAGNTLTVTWTHLLNGT